MFFAISSSVTRIDDENSMSRKERKKHRREHVSYNVVSSADAPTRLTLKLSKSKHSSDDKRGLLSPQDDSHYAITRETHGSLLVGLKRLRSNDEDSNEASSQHSVKEEQKDPAAVFGEYAPSLSDRVKRRRRQTDYSEDSLSSSHKKEKSRGRDLEVIDLDEDSMESSRSSIKDSSEGETWNLWIYRFGF